jgi:hypothetical protein
VVDLLERGKSTVSVGELLKYDVPSVVTHGYDKTKVTLHQEWNESETLVRSQKLFLYVGQSVIFTSNGIDRQVANNSQGTIEEIVLDETTQEAKMLVIKPVCNKGLHMPSVKVFRDHRVIGKSAMAVRHYNNNISQYHFAVREQFPIKPASWANAYSVQGLTFMDMILIYNNIRARKKMFGYLYVLISRLQNIFDFVPLRKLVREDRVS